MESYQTRYTNLSDLLSSVTLHPLDKRPDNCVGDFFKVVSSDLLCGYFRQEEIATDLAETGCIQHWHQQGYHSIRLMMNRDELYRYQLSVMTEVNGEDALLFDLVVWMEYIEIEYKKCSYPSFYIEHLRLQQPGKDCGEIRMPGQIWASSHLLRKMFHIISHWAARTGATVITEIPEYFHTAYIFSQYFKYIDPEMESIYRDFVRDLLPENPSKKDISIVSQNFEDGLIYRNGMKYLWPTEMQYYVLSNVLSD